jgi:hypothetical protein
MATRTCRICGQENRTSQWWHGRCPRCAKYWHRHGIERPLELHPIPLRQTCGQLARPRRQGRCPTCYYYWRRTGRERPPRLWEH